MGRFIAHGSDTLVRLYSRIAPTERGGYRLARFARRFHSRNDWRATFTTPADLRMRLDLATYPDCCMAYGLYELVTARLIRRLLRPGDHFVDGGANIGYFTLLAAQRVGASGRVDAFEPQPDNRARLDAHVRDNGFVDRVRIHALALADRDGDATIHLPQEARFNHGGSSLFATGGASVASPVRTVRMDAALAGTTPRLIKLDIEGAEPLAVAGMEGLLRGECPPAVIMEHNIPAVTHAGFAPTEAVDRLMAARPDFRVYVIGWRLRRIEPTAAVLNALKQVNLLFQPADFKAHRPRPAAT